MPRFALDLELDGRGFLGTQIQATGRTVQGVVAATLSELTGATVDFRPGSRLDQGVSARSFPGDCDLPGAWPEAVLGLALNQRLPRDLVVRRVAAVADGFSCLRSASVKTYRYRVRLRPVRPVLDHDCWWVRDLPEVHLLPELAAHIPGDRDLSGFATLRRDDSDADDPKRLYLAAKWSQESDLDGTVHTFRISGRGFLYRQVRGLVGAMIKVAQGRESAVDFVSAIEQGRSARRIGNIAPADGLLLEEVRFDQMPDWVVVDVANRPESMREPGGTEPRGS